MPSGSADAAGPCGLEHDPTVEGAPAFAIRHGCTAAHGLVARLADNELADESARLREGHPEIGGRFGDGVGLADLGHADELVHQCLETREVGLASTPAGNVPFGKTDGRRADPFPGRSPVRTEQQPHRQRHDFVITGVVESANKCDGAQRPRCTHLRRHGFRARIHHGGWAGAPGLTICAACSEATVPCRHEAGDYSAANNPRPASASASAVVLGSPGAVSQPRLGRATMRLPRKSMRHTMVPRVSI